jgi:hypothetical protein
VRSHFGSSSRFGFRFAITSLASLGAAAFVSCAFPDYTFSDENCFNGVDDDKNGAIDCADPGCAALVTCVVPPAAGWAGPVSIWEGSEPSTAPACGSTAYPHTKFDALHLSPSSEQVSCPECECSQSSRLSSPKCVARLQIYSNGSCTGTHQLMTDAEGAFGFEVNQTCTTVNFDLNQFEPSALSFSDPYPVDDSCVATKTGTVVRPPITYGSSLLACDLAGITPPSGCSDQKICAPKPNGGLSPYVCVYRQIEDADPGCTGDYYTIPILYYEYTDGRNCKECTCQPAGVTCVSSNGTTYGSWYSDALCSGGGSSIQSGMSCVAVPPGNPTALYAKLGFVTTSGNGGSCQPTGGTPVGDIKPLNTYRFCCTQIK